MKQKHLLFLPLILLYSLIRGQNPITTAVPFLSISPDARSSSLAGCGAASEADVFSMYYNPAKYAFIKKNTSVGGGYSHWMKGGTHLFNIAAAQRVGKRSALAASFRYHNGMTVDYHDEFGFLLDLYRPYDFAVDLTYAIRLNDAFSLALAGRYIQSADFNSNNFFFNPVEKGRSIAFDLGMYYQKPVNLGVYNSQYALGTSITNMGSKMEYGNGWNQDPIKTAIPTTLRLGTSLKTEFNKDHVLTCMVDFTRLLFCDTVGNFKEELLKINYGLGLEYAWKDLAFVRTGYFNQPRLMGNRKYLSFGLGVAFNHFGIDAAYNMSTTSFHNTDYLLVDAYFFL